jgi:hypothetical protein
MSIRHRLFPTPRGEWNGPRLPDGQPDVFGDWSNTIGNHNNLTDAQGPLGADDEAPPTLDIEYDSRLNNPVLRS